MQFCLAIVSQNADPHPPADLAGHGEGLHAWSEGLAVQALRGRVAQLRRREPPLTSSLTCAPAHQDAAVLRFCVGAARGVNSS